MNAPIPDPSLTTQPADPDVLVRVGKDGVAPAFPVPARPDSTIAVEFLDVPTMTEAEIESALGHVTTQPDLDGGVDMTAGEWAAFRGECGTTLDTFGFTCALPKGHTGYHELAIHRECDDGRGPHCFEDAEDWPCPTVTAIETALGDSR